MISTKSLHLDEKQLAVLDRYELGHIASERILSGGMFARPLLLESERGLFVLRTHRFRNEKSSFRFQAETIAFATEQGISCASVVRGSDGNWSYTLPNHDGPLALHEYVEGRLFAWSQWHQKKENVPSFLRHLGSEIAKLHNALAQAHPGGDSRLSYELPPMQFKFFDSIYANWQSSMEQLSQLEAATTKAAAMRFLELEKEIDHHWQRLAESLKRLKASSLATQIVHGDISPVNLVFHDDDSFGFIDWDCVHIGARLYDALGDVLNRPPAEQPELNMFRRDHIESYLEGYSATIEEPLTQQELDLIPAFCLARQLEDLRQRMQVVNNLDANHNEQYSHLIKLRVEMMQQIQLT